MDWIGAGLIGASVAGVVVSYQQFLHNRNVKAKDQDREFHRERAEVVNERFDQIDQKHIQLDKDIKALTVQMGATITDVERRFLPRTEHAETIAALRTEMQLLVQQLSTLNSHMFDFISRRAKQ